MNRPFHSFKLIGDPNSVYKKVFMDGQELKGVVGANLRWRVDEVPTIWIKMITTDIEIEDYNGEVYEDKSNGRRDE